jgi:transcriptional regulator with XRE-family HTH domain
MSVQKASRRIKAGWRIEQVFEIEPPPERKPTVQRELIVQGKVFSSVKQAAEEFKIPIANVRARLALGWTAEEALELTERIKERKPRDYDKKILCEGREFPSIGKFAEAYRLPYKLVYKRLRLGWSPEQAVELEEQPPRYRNADGTEREHSWVNPVTLPSGQLFADSVDGKYYLYVIENSVNNKKYVGITTTSLGTRFYHHKSAASSGEGKDSKLYNAMRKFGEDKFSIRLLRCDAKSIEELLKQETDTILELDTINRGYNTSYGGTLGTVKPITVDGIQFSSMGQAADYFEIEPYNFNQRITKLGWTPEEAAELVERSKYGRRNIVLRVEHNGTPLEFGSQAKAAEYFNLKAATVSNRLKLGWSLEQALELKPSPSSRRQKSRDPLVFEGQEYSSLKELAECAGVSYQSLSRYRRESSLSTEDIVYILKNNLGTKMQRVLVSEGCDHVTALRIIRVDGRAT